MQLVLIANRGTLELNASAIKPESLEGVDGAE
jgi:hypothetical protein